jgi:hypothetical protein
MREWRDERINLPDGGGGRAWGSRRGLQNRSKGQQLTEWDWGGGGVKVHDLLVSSARQNKEHGFFLSTGGRFSALSTTLKGLSHTDLSSVKKCYGWREHN